MCRRHTKRDILINYRDLDVFILFTRTLFASYYLNEVFSFVKDFVSNLKAIVYVLERCNEGFCVLIMLWYLITSVFTQFTKFAKVYK